MAMAQRSVSTSGEIDYPSRLISPQTNSNGLAVTFPVLRASLSIEVRLLAAYIRI
uniref:Uncharacterized protein n=1 Tax=Aegilops tauschii TaxID=37682 RepID=M8AY78_AEGTA